MNVDGNVTSSEPAVPRSNCHRHCVLTITYRSSSFVSCRDTRVVDRWPMLLNSCLRFGIIARRSAAWTSRAPVASAAMKGSAYCDVSRSTSSWLVFFSKSLKKDSIDSLTGAHLSSDFLFEQFQSRPRHPRGIHAGHAAMIDGALAL